MTNEELNALNIPNFEALETIKNISKRDQSCLTKAGQIHDNESSMPDYLTICDFYAKHHATIKAIESGDWVLVPREPDKIMRRAGRLRLPAQKSFDVTRHEIAVYKAMLSAAPKIGGETM